MRTTVASANRNYRKDFAVQKSTVCAVIGTVTPHRRARAEWEPAEAERLNRRQPVRAQGEQSEQGLLEGKRTNSKGEDGEARTHRCAGRAAESPRAGGRRQWGAAECVYPGTAPLVGERERCALRLRRGRVGPDDGRGCIGFLVGERCVVYWCAHVGGTTAPSRRRRLAVDSKLEKKSTSTNILERRGII
jgi:hypothetical protein